MPDRDHASVLRRKLGVHSTPSDKTGATRPEIDAMRAAARAAYSTSGVKVEMREASAEDIAGLGDLIRVVQPAMLIVPFTAQDEVEGYVALSHEFAQSLIEKATTGRLSSLPVEPRKASSIDMLLCRDFLSCFLDIWREISEGKPTLEWLDGYAAQNNPIETDLMALNSRDVPYRVFSVEMRFDERRDASLTIAFPVQRHRVQTVKAPAQTDQETDWGKVWRDAVLDTRAELDAVLAQVPVPLLEVKGWQVGDLITLPATTISSVTLGRRGGNVVATARLGQARGHRALRLNSLSKEAASAALPAEETAPPQELPEPPEAAFEEQLGAQNAATETALEVSEPTGAADETGGQSDRTPDGSHDVLE